MMVIPNSSGETSAFLFGWHLRFITPKVQTQPFFPDHIPGLLTGPSAVLATQVNTPGVLRVPSALPPTQR